MYEGDVALARLGCDCQAPGRGCLSPPGREQPSHRQRCLAQPYLRLNLSWNHSGWKISPGSSGPTYEPALPMSTRPGHRVPHPVFTYTLPRMVPPTTSLGSPVQCQITHSVKKCFLMTNLNLPWCISELSSCPMPCENSPTPTWLQAPPREMQGAVSSPPSLLFSGIIRSVVSTAEL